jgi:hypothetical protein
LPSASTVPSAVTASPNNVNGTPSAKPHTPTNLNGVQPHF